MTYRRKPVRRAKAAKVKSIRVGYCEACRKSTYSSRDGAKSAAKRTGPGMTAYECQAASGWHFGHLPWVVKVGVTPRADIVNVDRREVA